MTAFEDTLQVRVAGSDDLAGLKDVAERTWRHTYAGKIPDDDINAFLQSNYNLERLAFVRESMGDGMLVVISNAQVVGYVMITKDRDGIAQIWAIYVLPEWQRQGVGTRLWRAALDRARHLESPELALWVLSENTPARRFYEQQGAHAAGERDFPVGGGSVAEVCYRLSLG